MKISVIYPSRSRPEICKATLSKWIECAYLPEAIEWIVSVDQDDPCLSEYVKFYNPGKFILEISRNRSCVDAINIAASKCTGDLLVVISDDFLPFNGWDGDLKNEVFGKEDFLLKTRDGIQPTLVTLPILDRKYYNRFGYVYHPSYFHLHCDEEMTIVSLMLGKYIKSNLFFEHCHHSVGKFQRDALSDRNDASWGQGQSVLEHRAKDNFGIKDPLIKREDIQWR